jgi:hypothetical protein
MAVKKPKSFDKWSRSMQNVWLKQHGAQPEKEVKKKPTTKVKMKGGGSITFFGKPEKIVSADHMPLLTAAVRVFNPRPPGVENTKHGKRESGLMLCPFCDTKPHCVDNITHPATKLTKSVTRYYVWCTNPFCNARGPLTNTPEAAILLWNTRAKTK